MDSIEITYTTKRTLPKQFFYDVMCTMVETPYGDWWHFIDVNRDADLNILDFTCVDIGAALDEDWPDIEQHIKDGERYVVTPEKIGETIERILKQDVTYMSDYIEQYIRRAVQDDDAGDIDAIAADCILQVACLEEVVYG